MEINNILLTGEIKVGKSTIINKVIEKYFSDSMISGFKTLPFYEDDEHKGFYIEDQCEKDVEPSTENTVGRVLEKEHRCYGIEEVFENKGVDILNSALGIKSDLIVLDELGFFENNSENFKKKIIEILESPIRVIGVLKKKDTEFLNSIKSRSYILVIEVTKENRDSIEDIIRDYWNLCIL